MAGSIQLSMSQQFALSGSVAKPLSGGKLYFIAAGTTSDPQSAFQDIALTIPHQNPIILDEAGRIPAFYLADGQIKIRLVDSKGLTVIEQDNLLVIGPSSGDGGGGGAGVDPTTVFKTGDVNWQPIQGTRPGWVRHNGRTIGSAVSGASERANVDCEALFSFLWNKYPDFCPVSNGRGGSAAADWTANKTIQLLALQNSFPGGLDDMGNTAVGGFANVPIVTGNATTAGSILGESVHTLTVGELAQHDHTAFLHDPGHGHATDALKSGQVGANNPGGISATSGGATIYPATTGITLWSDGDNTGTQNKVGKTGSGMAHNNVPKAVLGTYFVKL